ncbi:MAG: response regulator [Sulfurovum sp.]|nr:response regulator [Sulfurovum sp.]
MKKKIDLIFDLDSTMPTRIYGDPLRLTQILINLMSNAVKFTDQGEVVLSAKLLLPPSGKKLLEFKISDTGIGLKDDQIANLFQTFSQADISTSRQFGGTGLGLTIAKQLVELMGGNIRVESVYGEGSDFIFTIEIEVLKENTYPLSLKKINNHKILIFDENNSSRKALEKMLHNFGYDVLNVSNMEELFEHISKDDFNILFLDKALVEASKNKLTKDKDKCKAKIVLMHHHEDHLDDNILEYIDIDAKIIKPFNHQSIFNTMQELYGDKRISQIESNTFMSKTSLNILSGSHILIAEDNEINQSILLALLEDTGIKITIANNGQEVLDMIENIEPIDLIFMDIKMPLMGGYETVEHLKENPIYSHIPIIAFSGSARKEDKEEAMKAGMDNYLTKPIDVNLFYQYILKYVKPKKVLF